MGRAWGTPDSRAHQYAMHPAGVVITHATPAARCTGPKEGLMHEPSQKNLSTTQKSSPGPHTQREKSANMDPGGRHLGPPKGAQGAAFGPSSSGHPRLTRKKETHHSGGRGASKSSRAKSGRRLGMGKKQDAWHAKLPTSAAPFHCPARLACQKAVSSNMLYKQQPSWVPDKTTLPRTRYQVRRWRYVCCWGATGMPKKHRIVVNSATMGMLDSRMM